MFNDIASSSSKYVFLIYLIISSNFLANLFSCNLQNALNHNMQLKHLLGFMTMYFFVVLADSDSKYNDDPKTQFLYSLLFYTIFVLTTKTDFKWWIAFIICLSVFSILQVFKNHKKTEDKDKYEKYQIYLSYLSGVILIIGFLVYYGKKKAEYGSQFNTSLFLFGKPDCKNNSQNDKLSDYQSLMNIFN